MAFGQLAPAGTALTSADLLSWVGNLPRAEIVAEELRDLIRRRYDVRHCFLLSSGRAALFLLLRSFAKSAGGTRNEVVVPAYTCYSVPAAAVRAGLRVRVCDIDPATLSYDLRALEAIDFSNVAAIVTSNLYGIPNDLPAIEKIAHRHGVLLIDDSAQSMDSRIGGRAVGTFGDAGLYSFDKGKNITSIQGGVIVTNSDEVAVELQRVCAELPAAPATRTAVQAMQLLIYAVFLRPWLYWLPANLLKLGDTVYTTDYPVERYSASLAPIAAALFKRIDAIGTRRIATAQAFQRALAGLPGLSPVSVLPDAEPVFLRLPLLATDPQTRACVLDALAKRRLGATGSYPLAIADVPGLKPHLVSDPTAAGAGRWVASTILTLPTHHYTSQRHIEEVAAVVRETLESDPHRSIARP